MKLTITNKAVDLGKWLGQNHAFGVMSGRTTAAQVMCMKEIRDTKKYREAGVNWDVFCPEHFGMSRASVDRDIGHLEEFGEGYFHLHGMTRITPEDYRLIAASVTAEGLTHGGEYIAIEQVNASKLVAAVKDLREKAKAAKALPAPAGETAPVSFARAEKLMASTVAEVKRLMETPMPLTERVRLQHMAGRCADKLRLIEGEPIL
jgi:hypothetical protein